MRQEKDLGVDLKEPKYDEEDNGLSEGDFGFVSSTNDSNNNTASPIHRDTSQDKSPIMTIWFPI